MLQIEQLAQHVEGRLGTKLWHHVSGSVDSEKGEVVLVIDDFAAELSTGGYSQEIRPEHG